MAQTKIKFLVVGGGIGGVACAYALRRSGHDVHVLEEAKGLGQNPAGILRSPPNLTNILVKWGLGAELTRTALKCRGTPLIDIETGEQIGLLDYPEGVLKETGADFLILRHEDLHRMLYKLALDAGATVQFDAKVVDINPGKPSVRLRTGETISADVLIGADGFRSRVRDVVLGSSKHIATPSGISMYIIDIPTADIECHPELQGFLDIPSSQSPIWMGSGRSVMGLSHINGKHILHLFWPDDNEPCEESWTHVTPLPDLDLSSGESQSKTRLQEPSKNKRGGSLSWIGLQKLIKLATSAVRTKYMNHEPIENWVHENGKVVIIGDAAHPHLPAGGFGPSMAVEDAAVLGSLFSRLRTRDRITNLLFAFQEVRSDRCAYAQETELSNANVVWMKPGPERDARDASMREAQRARASSWDDDYLQTQWEMLSTIMAYDAYEAADEWWLQWGSLREKAEGLTNETPPDAHPRTDPFYTIDVVHEPCQTQAHHR